MLDRARFQAARTVHTRHAHALRLARICTEGPTSPPCSQWKMISYRLVDDCLGFLLFPPFYARRAFVDELELYYVRRHHHHWSGLLV